MTEEKELTILTALSTLLSDYPIIYTGEAVIGSTASQAVWRISRIATGAADVTTTKYADGNNYFDNVWNDRESLTYS